MKPFLSVFEAVKNAQKGKIVILIDNKNRENEGDFFLPAVKVTPKHVNFMITYGRGILCNAITRVQALRLDLPLMVSPEENTESTQVNFAVSVNARKDIGSGVSAFDRSQTIKVLSNPGSAPSDLTRPGHIFPLIAHPNGLYAREGHTEAAVTLSKLAGFNPAGILCEIIGDSGRMAGKSELIKLANRFNIGIVAVDDLAEYIKINNIKLDLPSPTVAKTASSLLPTKLGNFEIMVYKSGLDRREHAVVVRGNINRRVPVVRIHSRCLTGDLLGSVKCDCGEQLNTSLDLISQSEAGILIYLDQEGRGIGLSNKIKAYSLQEKGLDTVEANECLGFAPDPRDYTAAAEILKDIGAEEIALLTNNPAKVSSLRKAGIKVARRLPLECRPNKVNKSYLETKKNKMGHKLSSIS